MLFQCGMQPSEITGNISNHHPASERGRAMFSSRDVNGHMSLQDEGKGGSSTAWGALAGLLQMDGRCWVRLGVVGTDVWMGGRTGSVGCMARRVSLSGFRAVQRDGLRWSGLSGQTDRRTSDAGALQPEKDTDSQNQQRRRRPQVSSSSPSMSLAVGDGFHVQAAVPTGLEQNRCQSCGERLPLL